ncbi:hypothetical protein sce0761 [Sorangium cellulosum So ce56]|uniref:Uncharacterized protein n=1 Tax=Sorangium cellulosum (strain So ce56) TaxID=448385 RepID=A9ENY8_SORC5|nr:hypothetical protein sce0761 [Sorangium cellulosum So ce56]
MTSSSSPAGGGGRSPAATWSSRTIERSAGQQKRSITEPSGASSKLGGSPCTGQATSAYLDSRSLRTLSSTSLTSPFAAAPSFA